MIEKLILLEGVDPIVFFGSNNVNFDKITSLFPHVKIVARGNEIKIFAEEGEINAVFEKIIYMIDYCKKYKNFPDDVFDWYKWRFDKFGRFDYF